MALKFFWRCEGTTLDGTHDYSIGDTTATANGTPTISATAARIGSNGVLIDASEWYEFDTPDTIVNRLTGSAAFWFQCPTAFPSSGQVIGFYSRGATFENSISVRMSGTDELNLRIDSTTGPVEQSLLTTAANIAVGNWYFVVVRWDQPNNDRCIEVYDTSGTLIQKVEDTSTAYTAPTELNDSGGGLRYGNVSGSTNTLYIDNVFVADSYAEPLQDYLTITSYVGYGKATFSGAPVAVAWAAGSNPAGQSITVPVGTTAVYMFWHFGGWGVGDGAGLASATLNGSNPNQTHELPVAAGADEATGVAIWYNPSTGSQTLDVAWDASPTEGPTTIVAFVKNGDLTNYRDVDSNAEAGTVPNLVTLTTVVGDLVIKFDNRDSTSVPSLTAGWVNGQTQTNNSDSCRLSYIWATGATQVCDSEDENYSQITGISIPPPSGVPVGPPSVFRTIVRSIGA